jgi:hypothetical protein
MTAFRRLGPVLSADLQEKMVLLAGPRQCGKTTLAQGLVEARGGAYFAWDVPAHRRALNARALPEEVVTVPPTSFSIALPLPLLFSTAVTVGVRTKILATGAVLESVAA